MEVWMCRGVAACALWPLSLVFRILGAARRIGYLTGLFRSFRLPVPVIVVGNLFIGGTGKTPLTIWLVETLQAAGYRPGVVSRGYGGKDDGVQNVTSVSSARCVGDEPVLIARRTGCPLVVGRDRFAAGRALLHAYPDVDVIVTDDGLQHYRLARDIEIVLSDSRGAGNGWLLPAGPLREPLSRRRDFSVENAGTMSAVTALDSNRFDHPVAPGPGAVDAAGVGHVCSNTVPDGDCIFEMELTAPVAEQLRDRTQRTPLAAMAAMDPAVPILAAAGIGHPARFFASLRAAGLSFNDLPLPDHHAFSSRTFENYDVGLILITEKDAVKCLEVEALAHDPRIWVVPVSARFEGPFAEKILEKLRGYATA